MSEQNIFSLDEINSIEPAAMDGSLESAMKIKEYNEPIDLLDAARSFTVNQRTIEMWRQPPTRTLVEAVGAGVKSSLQDISDIPAHLDLGLQRLTLPSSDESEARNILAAGMRRSIAVHQARAEIAASKGQEYKIAENLASGFTQAGFYALTGLATTGLGIGITSGIIGTTAISEYAQKSQEWAEKYAMQTGDFGLKGYGKDKELYAATYGLLAGYIEGKLGVERMIEAPLAGIKKASKQALLGAAGEGSEEFLQEMTGWAIGTQARIEDRDIYQAARDGLTGAVYGAIVGGVMGGAMYYVNREKIVNYYKTLGFRPAIAKQLATQAIDDTKSPIINEIITRDQITGKFGESYNNLISKIDSALSKTNWQANNPGLNQKQFVQSNAELIGRQIITMAAMNGTDTADELNLAEIESDGNVVFLNPNSRTIEQIDADIVNKKLQVKELITLAKTGAGNAAKKSELNLQIEILQKLREKRTGERYFERKAARRKAAEIDAAAIMRANPQTSAIIDSIQIMPVVPATKQIQDKLDDEQFFYAGNKQIPVSYELMEMENVIPSHIKGEINPRYTLKELQNRESRGSVADLSVLMARAATLQPENLGIAPNMQNGAPIVNDRNEIIAGNGRYEVLALTDEKGRKRYNRYLERLGLEPSKYKNPILVRKTSGLTDEQSIALADASNVSITSAFDEASQAKQDAKLLKGTRTALEFFAKIPTESQQGLILSNGLINNVALRQRYENALMMDLLDGDVRVYNILYSQDEGSKIIKGITQALPNLYAFEEKNPIRSIKKEMKTAIVRLNGLNKGNFILRIQEQQPYSTTEDLFIVNSMLYNFIYSNAQDIAKFYNDYVMTADTNDIQSKEKDIFGNQVAVELTNRDIFSNILVNNYSLTKQGESTGIFDENGIALQPEMRSVFTSKTINPVGFLAQNEITPSLFADTSLIEALKKEGMTTKNPLAVYEKITKENIALARSQGYDAIAQLENDKIIEYVEIKSVDNVGTYNLETGNIYKQSSKANGYYDPELQVIVLGNNTNSGTIAHEMAHYWLDKIWRDYNSWKNGRELTSEWENRIGSLFDILGIKDSQKSLTREQHEQFATMWEAYLFQLSPLPEGASYAFGDFAKWAPEKYKNLSSIGYKDSEGRIHNPLLDARTIDWFNAWVSNVNLPSVNSPARLKVEPNRDNKGNIIPAKEQEIREIEKEIQDGSKERKSQVANEKQLVDQETTQFDKGAVASKQSEILSKPDLIELEMGKPEGQSNKYRWWQRNRDQEQVDKAKKYYLKNQENAEYIAFGDPQVVVNDTDIDRSFLIREVMDHYAGNEEAISQLRWNFAQSRSLAGTALRAGGVESVQLYLNSMRKILHDIDLENAIKLKYGRGEKGIELMESAINHLISKRADSILSTKPDSQERNQAIDRLMKEAALAFGGTGDSRFLKQEDITGQRTRSKEVFVNWANKEVKRLINTKAQNERIAKVYEMSEKARKAAIDIDSNDPLTYETAAGIIKEFMEFRYGTDKNHWFTKVFGGWAINAMLSNPGTHITNILGNTFNYAAVLGAVKLQFAKTGNDVSKSKIDAANKKMRVIYDSNYLNLATMMNIESESIVIGEKYKLPSKATNSWINIPTRALSYMDSKFRFPMFSEVAALIATREAKATKGNADEIFDRIMSMRNQKGKNSETRRYAELRQEALHIANIATFTQNGTLASVVNQMRTAINKLTGDPNFGIGNLISPFIKTPANLVELGARAIASPLTSAYKGLGALIDRQGRESGKYDWTIQDTLAWEHLLAGIIFTVALASDYEPPYEFPIKYDPNKPYDSIKIGGVWISLDSFGPFAYPIRLAASSLYEQTRFNLIQDTPLIGEVSKLYESMTTKRKNESTIQSLTNQAVRIGYDQTIKLYPAILTPLTKFIVSETTDAKLGKGIAGIGTSFGRKFGLDGGEYDFIDALRETVIGKRVKVE